MARTDPDKLAAALRENLRRRKEQARGDSAQPSQESDDESDVASPIAGNDHAEARVSKT